jgi:hypothetical protein
MSKDPGHYTEHGTRKFQANGRVEWSRLFTRVAAGKREGEGIRAALAYAATHASQFEAWAKAHPEAWAPAAHGGPAGKPGKAAGGPAKGGKAARTPKATGQPKAARKAARKAAGKAKAPAAKGEQLPLAAAGA